MKLTALSVRAWPGLRTDSNSGAEAGALPRLANRGSDDRRDQHLADLVALAHHFKLGFAAVAADDLRPGQADELGDAQAPEVAHLQ
jgi:hypothetical protein